MAALSSLTLDDVIAGQPSGPLAWADPPAAGDLAAFVHTGGTTGAAFRAHRGDHRRAEDRRAHPRQPACLWPGDRAVRRPGGRTLAQVPVGADISSLRLPIVGASPLPATVREAFAQHTGRRLLEGYGLTEATRASTFTPPGEERPGSAGRALPGQRVKAVRVAGDGSWADCAPGEIGALAIGGPAVFAAYVSDPDAAAHEDGRLVVTVTGADPGRVHDAATGFPLTIRCLP
jgi:AMP-binding enzyme